MWPPPPRGEPAARFAVAVPPSTNNLFVSRRDGKGRAKTSAYKAWELEAGWQISQQGGAGRTPLKHVAVLIEAPLSYQRDLDNSAKPPLDLLKTMGIIVDDRYVDDLRIVRVTGIVSGNMIVSIWPIPEI